MNLFLKKCQQFYTTPKKNYWLKYKFITSKMLLIIKKPTKTNYWLKNKLNNISNVIG